MSGRDLIVYLNGNKTGILHESRSSALRFTYTDEAEAPISLAMPLNAVYGDEQTRAFFENLLPEGDLQEMVAQAHHVSSNNPFSLLKEIGRDCAGAVVLGDDLLLNDTTSLQELFDVEQFVSKNDAILHYELGMRHSLAGA